MPISRPVRRLVMPPAVVLLALFVFTTTPLLVLAAAAASPFLPGRLRPLRILMFVLVYLALEAVLVLALGVLWVAAGAGRRMDAPAIVRAHYRLVGWFLRVLMGTARHAFDLRVGAEGPDLAPVGAGGSLIVLARHAGPGDSFLLLHELVNRHGRMPRIVLKDSMQWDPCIDIALNRLPTRFISTDPARRSGTAESIAGLASGMGPADALVIFPEGGNFSERRRLHSIAKLEELGRHQDAARARELRHVLSPRPGGVLAALAACPEADVVLVAHAGLEDLSSAVDLWRGLPIDAEIKVRMWRVASADVPRRAADRSAWLGDEWSRIDGWIADQLADRARERRDGRG